MKRIGFFALALGLALTACNKKGCTDTTALNFSDKAEEDDGSCIYAAPSLEVPVTYAFTDDAGNNTVSYSGQTARLDQLAEMTVYMKSGTTITLYASILKDMFANTGDNGGGNFSFSSSKQLKSKCFEADVDMFEGYMDELALASESNGEVAADGQAGVVTNGEKSYLVAANGIEYTQLIEKGLMGAVFMYQATQFYMSDEQLNVDNSMAVSVADGKYYTEMEHHWDEAFGYFGVPVDFPTNTDDVRFWGKYCNNQNENLGSNAAMMDAFLNGRAVISSDFGVQYRDAQVKAAREMWERVSASQAVTYLEGAKENFGVDNAKFLHELSEAYAFILNLKYVPLETRVITFAEIEGLLDDMIGDNFWAVTATDLTAAINLLNSIYGF